MKQLFILFTLLTFTACQSEQTEPKKDPMPTDIKKTETIMAGSIDIKNISLNNQAGKITVNNGDNVSAKFEKKEWREWCLLHHKEENGTLKIMVENTSITGQGGCELHWEITLSSSGNLKIDQAAGMITGKGAVQSLSIQLAAGNLEWQDGQMPLVLQVAAGNVDLKNMRFPSEGESSIQVGTGQISITSPKGEKITTVTQNAIGKETNDFAEKTEGHQLKLKVAVGQVTHKAI